MDLRGDMDQTLRGADHPGLRYVGSLLHSSVVLIINIRTHARVGFTQIGAVRSALFEQNPTTEGGGEEETHLMDLIVSYEKSGLIADADRQIPIQRLLLHPNATLRVWSTFTNRPFGRVAFYWQIYVQPQASGAFR